MVPPPPGGAASRVTATRPRSPRPRPRVGAGDAGRRRPAPDGATSAPPTEQEFGVGTAAGRPPELRLETRRPRPAVGAPSESASSVHAGVRAMSARPWRLAGSSLWSLRACLDAPRPRAAGGVYNVVKCHPWHLEADEIEQAGGTRATSRSTIAAGTSSDRKIGIYNNGGAGNNAYSQYMYTAPVRHPHRDRLPRPQPPPGEPPPSAEILAYPGFQILASAATAPRAGPTAASTSTTRS